MKSIFSRRTAAHVVLAFLALLLFPAIVMWSWNIALPDIAGLPALSFRNALGLVLLATALSVLIAVPRRAARRPARGD